jgi:hypothetical protein
MDLEELLKSNTNPSLSLPGITKEDIEDVCNKLLSLSLKSFGPLIRYAAYEESVVHTKHLRIVDYYENEANELKLQVILSIQEYLNVFQYEHGSVSVLNAIKNFSLIRILIFRVIPL